MMIDIEGDNVDEEDIIAQRTESPWNYEDRRGLRLQASKMMLKMPDKTKFKT